MKIIEIIIAVVCIFIAIYNFDWYDFNRSVVSLLLLMMAIDVLIPHQKFRRYLRTSAVIVAIFLILKLLTTG